MRNRYGRISMDESPQSRSFSHLLKYIIPLAIAVAVGAFLLLKYVPEKKIEKEAVERIEALKEEAKEPIDLAKADHFVDAKTALSKKDRLIITTTPKTLLEDLSVEAESEIKLLVEEERTIITTPQELLKNRTIHPDAPIRVLKEGGVVVETTVRKLLTSPSITLDTPIKIIEKVEKVIVTTPKELQAKALSPETPIKVVVETPAETITLSQLLPKEKGVEKDTFYIHAVTRGDTQGIWGILQRGLMEQFLKGIPVTAEEGFPQREVLALEIPKDADERLNSGYSSFLGKVLDEKTKDSYVYNYSNGRMGKNPDYISPGQELVISRFSKEELIRIYKHFSQKQ
jgi:hypothetical protein